MYQFLGFFIGLLYLLSICLIYGVYSRARDDKKDAHGDSWSQRLWVSSKKPFLETSDSVFTWISLKVSLWMIVVTCIPSFFIKKGTTLGDTAFWVSNLLYYYNFILLFIFFLLILRLFLPFLLFFLPKVRGNKQEMVTALFFILLTFGFQALLAVLKNPIAVFISEKFSQFFH
ncbi:MAG: hypothetical protein ACKV1O_05545 [Saprospiraceae bacterium]